MTTIQKLKAIERMATIYNIHYCNAGVGFNFYEGPDEIVLGWKNHLHTYQYYQTFAQAVDAEYKRLKAMK